MKNRTEETEEMTPIKIEASIEKAKLFLEHYNTTKTDKELDKMAKNIFYGNGFNKYFITEAIERLTEPDNFEVNMKRIGAKNRYKTVNTVKDIASATGFVLLFSAIFGSFWFTSLFVVTVIGVLIAMPGIVQFIGGWLIFIWLAEHLVTLGRGADNEY